MWGSILLLLDFERQFNLFHFKVKVTNWISFVSKQYNILWTELTYLLYGGLAGLVLLIRSHRVYLSSLPFIPIRFDSIQLNSYICVVLFTVLCSCRFLRCRVRCPWLFVVVENAVRVDISTTFPPLQSTLLNQLLSQLPCLLKVPTCFQRLNN